MAEFDDLIGSLNTLEVTDIIKSRDIINNLKGLVENNTINTDQFEQFMHEYIARISYSAQQQILHGSSREETKNNLEAIRLDFNQIIGDIQTFYQEKTNRGDFPPGFYNRITNAITVVQSSMNQLIDNGPDVPANNPANAFAQPVQPGAPAAQPSDALNNLQIPAGAPDVPQPAPNAGTPQPAGQQPAPNANHPHQARWFFLRSNVTPADANHIDGVALGRGWASLPEGQPFPLAKPVQNPQNTFNQYPFIGLCVATNGDYSHLQWSIQPIREVTAILQNNQLTLSSQLPEQPAQQNRRAVTANVREEIGDVAEILKTLEARWKNDGNLPLRWLHDGDLELLNRLYTIITNVDVGHAARAHVVQQGHSDDTVDKAIQTLGDLIAYETSAGQNGNASDRLLEKLRTEDQVSTHGDILKQLEDAVVMLQRANATL